MSFLILFLLIVGAGSPHLNGYGTWADFAIGVGVLVASVLLFIYRRVVQDGEHVHLREDVPLTPRPDQLPTLAASPPEALGRR